MANVATRRTWLRVAAGVGLALAALVASIFILPMKYPTRQTARRNFTLDDDFNLVRKILVRTGGTKQIMTMAGDSEFLDQQWDTVGGGLDSLNPLNLDWKLDLNGKLKVRSRDDYVGRPVVTLTQVVRINREEVHSTVDLDERSERLWDYEMVTHFARGDSEHQTQVNLELTQEILTTAPWFAHFIADRRVQASADRALANQERAIRQLIADNRDKRWLLLLP